MAELVNIKKFVRIVSQSTKTGDSMLVESADGKTRPCPLFNWAVTVHDGNSAITNPNWIKTVEYHLHPTFTDPVRVVDQPPFQVSECGYGSFDMRVTIHFPDAYHIKPHSFVFPLRLDKERYEECHTIRLKNVPKDVAIKLVGAENLENSLISNNEPELLFGYDVDALADSLSKLSGPKVLKVLEMLKKFRTKATYIEEQDGEFHFDLYTLSPDAVAALWQFVQVNSGADA